MSSQSRAEQASARLCMPGAKPAHCRAAWRRLGPTSTSAALSPCPLQYGAEGLRRLMQHRLRMQTFLADLVSCRCLVVLAIASAHALWLHSFSPGVYRTATKQAVLVCPCPSRPQVAADERFEMVVPPRFGLVCFRLRGGDNQDNAALLEAVNRSGGDGRTARGSNAWLFCCGAAMHGRGRACLLAQCSLQSAAAADLVPHCSPTQSNPSSAGTAFLSHTMLGGRYVIRCALGGTLTQGCHVEAAWRTVQRCAGALLAA